jgi:hypothetical protein
MDIVRYQLANLSTNEVIRWAVDRLGVGFDDAQSLITQLANDPASYLEINLTRIALSDVSPYMVSQCEIWFGGSCNTASFLCLKTFELPSGKWHPIKNRGRSVGPYQWLYYRQEDTGS